MFNALLDTLNNSDMLTIDVNCTYDYSYGAIDFPEYVPEQQQLIMSTIESSSITSNSCVLSWGAVEGAYAYDIYTVDFHATTENNNITIQNLLPNSEYYIYVKAISDNSEILDSEYKYIVIKTLEAGKLPLTGITASTIAATHVTLRLTTSVDFSYVSEIKITINNNEYPSISNNLDKIITINNLTANTDYTISIQLISNSITYLDSDVCSINIKTLAQDLIQLNTPVVSCSPSDKTVTITWGAIQNAEKYEIVLNSTPHITSGTSIVLNVNPDLVYTVYVRALAPANSTTYIHSAYCSVTFRTLPTKLLMSNISVKYRTTSSITIAWTAVNNTRRYNIVLNGTTYYTTNLEYTLTNLLPGASYTIYVCAISNSSAYSDSEYKNITVTTLTENEYNGKLNTPVITCTNRGWSTLTFSWNYIANAVSYEIRWDNETTITSQTTITFKKTQLKEGTYYKIYVRAIAPDGYEHSDWGIGGEYTYLDPNTHDLGTYSISDSYYTQTIKSNGVTIFRLDKSKCTLCGVCEGLALNNCPQNLGNNIITYSPNKISFLMTPEARTYCINCGRCLELAKLYCPARAITADSVNSTSETYSLRRNITDDTEQPTNEESIESNEIDNNLDVYSEEYIPTTYAVRTAAQTATSEVYMILKNIEVILQKNVHIPLYINVGLGLNSENNTFAFERDFKLTENNVVINRDVNQVFYGNAENIDEFVSQLLGISNAQLKYKYSGNTNVLMTNPIKLSYTSINNICNLNFIKDKNLTPVVPLAQPTVTVVFMRDWDTFVQVEFRWDTPKNANNEFLGLPHHRFYEKGSTTGSWTADANGSYINKFIDYNKTYVFEIYYESLSENYTKSEITSVEYRYNNTCPGNSTCTSLGVIPSCPSQCSPHCSCVTDITGCTELQSGFNPPICITH